jgi:hypothetical protein
MTKDMNATLTVGFDVDQISDQLAFQFTSSDGGEPVHPTGLFSGEIHFTTDEILHFDVIGTGKLARFTSYEILDCCLITRPLVIAGDAKRTIYAAPSPFKEPAGASYPIAGFEVLKQENTPDGLRRKQTMGWTKMLTVANPDGRWEMSVYLTVRIHRPGLSPRVRVFMFDPESQVGAGGGADWVGCTERSELI